jgi:hypothetical protein
MFGFCKQPYNSFYERPSFRPSILFTNEMSPINIIDFMPPTWRSSQNIISTVAIFFSCTVNIQNPDCPVLSDSILVRLSNGPVFELLEMVLA